MKGLLHTHIYIYYEDICNSQSNLSVGDNKCLCPRRRFKCFYCGATICLKQLDVDLIIITLKVLVYLNCREIVPESELVHVGSGMYIDCSIVCAILLLPDFTRIVGSDRYIYRSWFRIRGKI